MALPGAAASSETPSSRFRAPRRRPARLLRAGQRTGRPATRKELDAKGVFVLLIPLVFAQDLELKLGLIELREKDVTGHVREDPRPIEPVRVRDRERINLATSDHKRFRLTPRLRPMEGVFEGRN